MDEIRASRVCVDRPLRLPEVMRAAHIARDIRPDNHPAIPSDILHPEEMALLTGKFHPVGSTLKVGFLGGSRTMQERVFKQIQVWSQYAMLDFALADAHDADVRIAFDPGEGSWSYLGTDILSIKKSEQTMNLGWIDDSTSDTEVRRVVLHEAGHSLGCIHEHQSPAEGIQWNREAVYAFFSGPPNNWSRQEIDEQIFNKLKETLTQHTVFDPFSIMEYEFSPPLVAVRIPGNTQLSDLDKSFIRSIYPGRDGGPVTPPPPPPPPKDLPVVAVGADGIRGAIPGKGKPARFTLHKDKASAFAITATVSGSGRRAPIVTLATLDSSQTVKLGLVRGQDGHYITKPNIRCEAGDYLLSIYHPLAGHGGFCWVEARYAA